MQSCFAYYKFSFGCFFFNFQVQFVNFSLAPNFVLLPILSCGDFSKLFSITNGLYVYKMWKFMHRFTGNPVFQSDISSGTLLHMCFPHMFSNVLIHFPPKFFTKTSFPSHVKPNTFDHFVFLFDLFVEFWLTDRSRQIYLFAFNHS